MGIGDTLPLRGRYSIRRADTGELLVAADNLITTLGKQFVGEMLRDGSGFDTGLTYMAAGTGTTAPSVADTQLATETVRGGLTGKTISGNVLTISRFFTDTEISFYIKELGVFGHTTASATPNSGTLFSRALLSYDNSANMYDLLISYDLTIG